MDVETRSRAAAAAANDALETLPVPSSAAILARGRRRRATRAAAAVGAIAALLVAGTAVGMHREHAAGRITTSGTPSTPRGRVGNRYVPPTRVEDGRVVMPVTLVDGHRFELVYPPSLDVAHLGYRGGASVGWPSRTAPKPCCDRVINVTYESLRDVYGDTSPVKTYRGFDGRPVRYYRTPNGQTLNELVYQFGPWLVQVFDYTDVNQSQFADAMTDHERAVFARSLEGHVDANGYLVLRARSPLRDLVSTDDLLGDGEPQTLDVELFANRCSMRDPATVEAHHAFGGGAPGISWCDRATGFQVSLTGPHDVVAAASANLRIRPAERVRPGVAVGF